METPPERFTVDQTPNPGDIDRTPATERANKMPPIAGVAMDPKKVIGLAAAAGAVMFTVLALGSDRKSTRLNSSHRNTSRMPSSA